MGIRGIRNRISNCIKQLEQYQNYRRMLSGLPTKIHSIEYKKYRNCLKTDFGKNSLYPQMDEFFCHSLECLSTKAEFSSDAIVPTVV